jgi:hypothetical protein
VSVPVVSRQGLGMSAAMSSTERPQANGDFDPSRHFRALLMRTKSRQPKPLKEQGNRSLRCETQAGSKCRRGRVAECRRLGSTAVT